MKAVTVRIAGYCIVLLNVLILVSSGQAAISRTPAVTLQSVLS